jgi:transposase-like protein
MIEKTVELVEGLILKPGAHGRRTYNREAKRALVELCKAPGVSVAGLALAHGITLVRKSTQTDIRSKAFFLLR